MKIINEWNKVLLSSFQEFFVTIMHTLPNIMGAIIILILGWLIARAMRYLIQKLFHTKSLISITHWINELPWTKQSEMTVDGASIIARFVYWIILLFFFIAASETLGWTAVSQTIGMLLSYLPTLLSAIIIAIVGLYIAQVVRKVILAALRSLEVGFARIISTIAFYIIVVFVILTAMDQAGVDTTAITSNVTLILGAVMFAFAIAFALAAKDILLNILSSFYSKQNFTIGNIIKVREIEGEIIKLNNVSVVIKTATTEVVLPAHTLISEKVEKLD